jgi:hypothetical protein
MTTLPVSHYSDSSIIGLILSRHLLESIANLAVVVIRPHFFTNLSSLAIILPCIYYLVGLNFEFKTELVTSYASFLCFPLNF